LGASLALAVSLIGGWLANPEPLAGLRSPELVASHLAERPVELMDGIELLAAEARVQGGSGLPSQWRGELLSAGFGLMEQATREVEALARRAGQMPALPSDPGLDQEPEQVQPSEPPRETENAPLDWSTEALRLRLKSAALRHLAGDNSWREALDGNFASNEQSELLATARALFQRAQSPAQPRASDPKPPQASEPGETEVPSAETAGSDQQSLPPAPLAVDSDTEEAPALAVPQRAASEQARRFDALGEGLAASHLRQLAAEAAGLSELARDIGARYEQKTKERAELLVGRLGLGLLLLMVGALFLIAMPFLGRERLLLSPGPGPAGTFGLADGWSVWAIYWLTYQLLLGLVGQFDPDHQSGLLVPLCSLPLIALVHGLIARRSERSTLELLGLQLTPGRFGRLLLFSLGAWVLTLFGVYTLMVSLGGMGNGSWANPMFDLVISSDQKSISGLKLEAGLWAPIFEELAFRAVLFAGLRSRLSFVPAMLVSSLLFGMFHSYGLPGNLLIAWVGCLLCWCYERTRSLFPGILLHSIYNLGQLAMLELYR
jgi:membrane protease YdiL (CAAX protease family)